MSKALLAAYLLLQYKGSSINNTFSARVELAQHSLMQAKAHYVHS
jgi:hypothetical protein